MVDIHPPHGPVHSVKDFLFHLLTVVIGILIALSLEGLIEWHHHRQLAEETRSNLISEIRDNRDRLQQGLAAAPSAEQGLTQTVEGIEAYRKTRQKPPSSFNWAFGVFVLKDTAWKTAGSTGAITYLDYSEVPRYTRIYALQEEFLSQQRGTLEKWLDLQKWATRIDPKDGVSRFSNDELSKLAADASAALVHTQTEESTAKSLVEEYNKTLGDK